MKSIFSEEGLRVLETFARSNVVVGLDYDGTLAPIVRDPRQAWMRAATRARLAELTRAFPCVVVSGRPREQVIRFLGSLELCRIIGEHGFDDEASAADLGRFASILDEWQARIAPSLARIQGVRLERKRTSVAIHYRASRARTLALESIRSTLGKLPRHRRLEGKAVVEVLPPDAPTKAHALRAVLAELRCDRAVYLGDDATDEDVFVQADPATLGICVGLRASSASWCVPSQRDVDLLLETLVRMRRASPMAARGEQRFNRRTSPR